MKVPFCDLTRDERETFIDGKNVEEIINENIMKAREKKDYVLGGFTREFEENFAKYCGTKYCIGVGSGLAGLELSLRSLGIGQNENDEVITVANTFNATAAAINKVGANVVLADCGEDYNIDVERVEKEISRRTKAIMPVHLYGKIADVKGLEKFGVPIIEDACQAHGAIFENQRAGSFGVAGAFSFYPGKNLGGIGDGGAIVTNEEGLNNFLREARNYGQIEKYNHATFPDNSRLDNIQAAALVPKLGVLDEWNGKRMKNALQYYENLSEVDEILIPEKNFEKEHVYHLYVIQSQERDELSKYLNESGIQTGLHYPIPIHLQKSFAENGYRKGDFPNSERLSERILSLPMFPTLKNEEINYVSNKIKEFYSKK